MSLYVCVCACVLLTLCVKVVSVDPVRLCVCIFTGNFFSIDLYICITMYGCSVVSPSSEGLEGFWIRSSAEQTRPSSSPGCHEDPHPWRTEPFAEVRVRLPRILHPQWKIACASYDVV